MFAVIPRSVWKPNHDNGAAIIGTSEWEAAGKELWLHHSVTDPPGPDATLEEDCEHMRHFESIGESSFGAGISYTWIVMPSGRVFEGHSIDRQGTHTYQRNNRSRAICLAGRYHINALPQRMQNAVALLLRHIGATIDGPHSQVYATECPGKYARDLIPAMNALATSGAPIDGTEDEDMTRDEAQALWELHQVVVSGAKRDAKLNQDLGYVIEVLTGRFKEALARIALDVDEDRLAEALIARGFDGANVAEVKAAFVDVLRHGVDATEG